MALEARIWWPRKCLSGNSRYGPQGQKIDLIVFYWLKYQTDNETATPRNKDPAFPLAAEMTNSSFYNNTTNVSRDDTADSTTGLDGDTDWMFNIGLADMDFSSIIRLPTSHFQENL